MNKLMSGRYFLTIITGVSFGYMVVSKSIDPKDCLQLITMVFVLYFTKTDRNGENNA